MKEFLDAINTFFLTLPYPSQRDVAPDVAEDTSYVVWSVLNDLNDDAQANYADESQGADIHLRVHCWATLGADAATAHDTVNATLAATAIIPVGWRPLKRPSKQLSRPVRDPDGRHHQVVSEWLLRFTRT